ncbi:MAG: tRNA (5-methylaminomethyl-2-thiouridine)(34)-methyltransferase MnmD [Alphaproteobacteria bacterium]|nr:tRNA (5-methylaminomethyl-2-thiouridine)(34)-methyltransferase MnmD [Alphaproteobacteria bacterium]
MNTVPRSEIFDDIYFSPADGLAETAHVFLQGNNLPDAWAGKSRFVIGETGFGTGLNFFSAWKLFEETAKPGQALDFISVEKFPLKATQIAEYLAHWSGFFEGRLEKFCEIYPLTIPGFHRLQLTPSVTLTLVFDDANAALPRVEAAVDCWFLDGFKPSSNPDMWSEKVFSEMARLSKPGTSLATFTSAGFVRRGLEAVGFNVEKVRGFGTKREMTKGVFGP